MKKKFNLKRISMKGTAFVLSSALLLSLAGCHRYTSSSANSDVQYDTIDTMDEELVTNGIEQLIGVPDEEFKLEVNYKCMLENNSKWTVTSDKQMYMDINTVGLPEGYQVYIDNVHMDATIRSRYPAVDGITQDTMDDRIHNSQMLGFPISDNIAYNNIFNIEGQNDTFIQGTILGFNSISGGTIDEKRFQEKDYLDKGVYANKISSIIDLIVVRPDNTVHCVSVPSDIQITVWPFIRYASSGGHTDDIYYYYHFDEEDQNVVHDKLDEEDFLELTGSNEDQLTLKLK